LESGNALIVTQLFLKSKFRWQISDPISHGRIHGRWNALERSVSGRRWWRRLVAVWIALVIIESTGGSGDIIAWIVDFWPPTKVVPLGSHNHAMPRVYIYHTVPLARIRPVLTTATLPWLWRLRLLTSILVVEIHVGRVVR
jgi:hypothetical protein